MRGNDNEKIVLRAAEETNRADKRKLKIWPRSEMEKV